MGWKDFARDYLTFSRKERIGIISIIFLIFLIWISPKILDSAKPRPRLLDVGWASATKKLESTQTIKNKEETGDENPDALTFERSVGSKKIKAELFYFDPNKAAPEDWKRLGIQGKMIQTIQNYLSKGGHFYKPADLQKIYGMNPDDYTRLAPYIKIQDAVVKNQFTVSPNPYIKKTEIPSPKRIDINTADTSAFIALPGIGNKLAARIVSFREKLGGFYSIDQVGEIYGLADSTFQKIKRYLVLSNPVVTKLNVNEATKDEMKSHPYIKWTLANAIVEYRNQHGNFSSLEDLKKISLITDEILEKIRPYLECR
jgi:competence ComEA-like helix-hairpin-helix protein